MELDRVEMDKSDFENIPTYETEDLDKELCFMVQFYDDDSGEWLENFTFPAFEVKNNEWNAYYYAKYVFNIKEELPATVFIGYPSVGHGIDNIEYFHRWEFGSYRDDRLMIISSSGVELDKH